MFVNVTVVSFSTAKHTVYTCICIFVFMLVSIQKMRTLQHKSIKFAVFAVYYVCNSNRSAESCPMGQTVHGSSDIRI